MQSYTILIEEAIFMDIDLESDGATLMEPTGQNVK